MNLSKVKERALAQAGGRSGLRRVTSCVNLGEFPTNPAPQDYRLQTGRKKTYLPGLCVCDYEVISWGKEHLAYFATCCKDQAFVLQIFKKPPWTGQPEGSLSFCLVALVLVGIFIKSCQKRNKTMELPCVKDSPEIRC